MGVNVNPPSASKPNLNQGADSEQCCFSSDEPSYKAQTGALVQRAQ